MWSQLGNDVRICQNMIYNNAGSAWKGWGWCVLPSLVICWLFCAMVKRMLNNTTSQHIMWFTLMYSLEPDKLYPQSPESVRRHYPGTSAMFRPSRIWIELKASKTCQKDLWKTILCPKHLSEWKSWVISSVHFWTYSMVPGFWRTPIMQPHVFSEAMYSWKDIIHSDFVPGASTPCEEVWGSTLQGLLSWWRMPGRVFHQGNASFWIVHDCTKVAHSNTINTMVFKHLHFDRRC